MSEELAMLVLDPAWTLDAALAIATPHEIQLIARSYDNAVALGKMEPRRDGPKSDQVREWLKPIGMKSWPTLANKAEWLDAMLLALSDMPPAILVASLQRAVHQPFRFPGEVEAWIREEAQRITDRIAIGLRALRLRIERENAPTRPRLEAPGKRWTKADVDEANASFRNLGIATRFRLNGDQVENYQVEPVDSSSQEAH